MPNIIQRQIKLEQINILSEPDQNIDCVQLAPIKGLVFSGCGAKAIAYSGFLKYIQQSQHLQSITHVSGASSGALFATMFALGMDALDIQFIQTHLDMNLLRYQSLFPADAQRFEHLLELLLFTRSKKSGKTTSISLLHSCSINWLYWNIT